MNESVEREQKEFRKALSKSINEKYGEVQELFKKIKNSEDKEAIQWYVV